MHYSLKMNCITVIVALCSDTESCPSTLSPQVIGFIYGYTIEQFGWTVYIVLAGFAVSCVVSLSLLWSQ